MRTDELRTALRELADEEPPPGADLAEVHRRDRRHKTIIRASAAVATLVVAVGLFAVTRSGSARRVEISNSSKVTPGNDLQRIDFVVVPANDATSRALDDAAVVTHYAKIPKHTGGGESLLTGVAARKAACALAKDEGFAVEVREPGRDERALVAALPVGAQLYDVSNAVDLEIFMQNNANASQIAAIRNAIAHFDGVTGVTFFDHDKAYEEFKRIFADQPALVEATRPEVLPESFRVTTTGKNATDAIDAAFRGRPGVDTVIGGGQPRGFFTEPRQPTPSDAVCSSP